MWAHIKDVKDWGGLPQAIFINSTCWNAEEVKTLLATTVIDLLCVPGDKSGLETTRGRCSCPQEEFEFPHFVSQNHSTCLAHAAEAQSGLQSGGSRSWHQNQLYLHESRGWCTTSWRRHLYSLDQVRGQECAWVLPCKHLMFVFVFIVTFTLWLNASPPNPVRAHNSERGCSAPAPQDGLGHSTLWRTPPQLPQTRPSGIPSIWSSAMEYKSHSGKV